MDGVVNDGADYDWHRWGKLTAYEWYLVHHGIQFETGRIGFVRVRVDQDQEEA